VEFGKYTGAGNDFVITEASWPDEEGSPVARYVCSRDTGVGVDGLALVWRIGDRRVGVRFFNPDGSAFGTCGNGTRCAARFAVDRELVPGSPFTIETSDSEIRARVDAEADWVDLEYRMPVEVVRSIPVEGPFGPVEGWLVSIGVPHFVVSLDRKPEGSIEEVCRRIRHDPALGPEGANVNLVSLESRERGSIRTFERGVEGETLACGSGAMASVFALRAAGLCDSDLHLRVMGGCDLRIRVPDAPHADGDYRLGLAGPARHLFDGRFPELQPGRNDRTASSSDRLEGAVG
jgi:diaminopimelate epimerase